MLPLLLLRVNSIVPASCFWQPPMVRQQWCQDPCIQAILELPMSYMLKVKVSEPLILSILRLGRALPTPSDTKAGCQMRILLLAVALGRQTVSGKGERKGHMIRRIVSSGMPSYPAFRAQDIGFC